MSESERRNSNAIRESDQTILDSGATIREDANTRDDSTVRDDATILDKERRTAQSRSSQPNSMEGLEFRKVRELPARGSEADLIIVRDGGELRALKLYRRGINPKREILERYENISRECPDHIVGVFRIGYGKKSGRWYELLEYIEGGSVADALEKGAKYNFREFVSQLGEAVNALHEHGIAHRDLKPANILVRSETPLNLVLSDFGISSELDGASVRETERKGLTPMYAAPEDLLGHIVSRPADWWACGMIFYEILIGSHPFQGLSAGRIAYILTTQGVEIDESLPKDQKTLLAGLLTRNDKKRWGWKQVKAWLDGRDDIPVYYEAASDAGNKPFVFEGESYANLHDLALAFASKFGKYKAGKGMLARGNVAKWLQNTNQFDEEAILSEEIADNDADLYIFKFIRRHAPETPLSMYGKRLSPENILNWLNNGGGEGEQYILKLFGEGKIKKMLALLPEEERDPTLEAFADANWKKDLRVPFAAALAPEKFYWGPGGAPSTPLERVSFAERHPGLLSAEVWKEKRGDEIIIPPDIAERFANDNYEEAVAELMERAKNNRILYAADLPQKYANNIHTGSAEEYRFAVGRKNGLNDNALALIRVIQGHIAKLGKTPGRGAENVSQECALINDDLELILSGGAAWHPGMMKILNKIEADLRSLSGGASFMKFLRILVLFIILPCAALYFCYQIFTSFDFSLDKFTGSGIIDAISTILYIVCGLAGLAGGLGGLLVGLFFAWLLSQALKALAGIFAILLAFLALGLVGWGFIAYYRYQSMREPARDSEARLEAVKDLREQTLILKREVVASM